MIDRFEWRNRTFETISIGVPDRLAYVAACLRKSWGFKMNPDQITGLFNNDPGGSVGYRKNPIIGFDPIVTDIFLEPIRDFLGQEGNLRFFAAFGIPDDSLPVFDILGCEFQDLADPHAAPCHEFEHQPISWISGSENDFIDHILFQDLELGWFAGFEKFP